MKLFVLVLLIVSLFTTSFGQSAGLNITFLENKPVIDGLPGEESDISEWQNFSSIEKTNEKNKDVMVRYKIGYGYTYLYFLIESASDSIVYRDRAYQNGDGFHVVIAKPDSVRPTDEFYVLRFSPANTSKNQPARAGVWYYNINLSGKSLTSATHLTCQSSNGKSYFELLLPWSEINPYNPLFSDSIGINFCFVKAVGDIEKNYYFLKYDRRIQSELSKREYIPARFLSPDKISAQQSFVKLWRNNIKEGDNIRINTILLSREMTSSSFSFTVYSSDNNSYTILNNEVHITEGINRNEFVLPVEELMPGVYKLIWRCSDNSEGEIPFTILPEINLEKEKIILNKIKTNLSQGDYFTMLFMLQNLVRDLQKVKSYETADDIRERYLLYHNYVVGLEKDNQSISNLKGIFRRAFLSKIDSTLQPYSIKIPDKFDRNKKYPLFVILHGSGSDDRAILNNPFTENDFIEIAPFGRGTSNCYTTDNAEIDVREAVDDVIKNFPIDTSKIIIAGFSMGGYGAYRIFYEYPKLFKGIVVFSGHPDLANKFFGEGYPDFSNPNYLSSFKNIPVFIYHSKNDLNCPYDLTRELVEQLKKIGAKVEFNVSTNGGHNIMDKDNYPVYYKWLRNAISE